MSKPETITIDDQKYIRADAVSEKAESVDGMELCVIRTYSAGVHIGYVKEQNGQQADLVNSRRLWSWSNAASLSQVAMEGCKSNKYAMTLPNLRLTDVIEIIPVSAKAKTVFDKIKEWKA